MKPLSILAATTALAAGATSARADDAPIPDTATCDRLGLASSFSADFSATFWDEILGAELFGVGLTLRAQYMAEVGRRGDTPSMAGGYATVPLGWGKIESPLILPDGEESDFGVGNIELGGAGSVSVGGGAVLARLGVALPTAEDDDNNAGPVLSSPARITDIVLYPDETTTIRISGSYLQSFGQVFVRVDAGLDLPFADEDMSAFDDDDPLVRLNAAAGFRLDLVALMGELVTVGTTGDTAEDEDRFFHTFAFTARFVGGDVQPMASVVVPLDDGVNDFVDLTVIAGVTASLPVN